MAYVCVVDDDPCGELPGLCWHAIEAMAEGRTAEVNEADPWHGSPEPDDAWFDCGEDFGADHDLGGEA